MNRRNEGKSCFIANYVAFVIAVKCNEMDVTVKKYIEIKQFRPRKEGTFISKAIDVSLRLQKPPS